MMIKEGNSFTINKESNPLLLIKKVIYFLLISCSNSVYVQRHLDYVNYVSEEHIWARSNNSYTLWDQTENRSIRFGF